MALEGRELIARTIAIAQDIRTRINQIPGLYCFGEEKIGQPGVHSMDPTKVTVTVKGIGLSGSEVEYLLRHKYKIQVELSDLYNVLFIISLGDGQAEADALVHAFADLTNKYAKPKEMIDIPIIKGLPHPPEQIMSPRQALFAETKTVPFKEATGMVCAEIVTFYPPGIPMLCPGEQITPDIIEYCEILQAAGLHISGPEDPALQTIKVVEIGPL
jgi:arginine decarboxylase